MYWKVMAYFNMVPRRRHPFFGSILFLILLSKVSCNGCGSIQLPQVKDINETSKDVILWNVTYSIPNITWTMTPATSGVDPSKATQLNDYIQLNYSDSFLHIIVVKPLDKEGLFSIFKTDIDSIILQMSCSTPRPGQSIRTNITLAITAVNEFAPNIYGGPYNITMKEDTSIGSTVFTVNVSDPDVPSRDLIFVLESSTASKIGSKYFAFSQPSKPNLKLIHAIDYDELVSTVNPPIFHFVLNVTDNGGDGLSNHTTVSIVIEDVDDLPPVFLYPNCGKKCESTQFRIITTKTHRGPLSVRPIPLHAVDQDSLNYSITYSILEDQNDYHLSFAIDNKRGIISQIKDVNNTGIISVKAEENSTKSYSTVAVVLVEFPGQPSNQPVSITNEDSNKGFLIGIIVLAIMAAALTSVVAILVILHRKLKKRVEPSDSNSSTAKVSEAKLHVPKISEVNEVKPIPRTTGNSEDAEVRDPKDQASQDEKVTADNAMKTNKVEPLGSFPTPSQRNNLLDPIESGESSKRRKKKKKKTKDVLRKLGEEKHNLKSEISGGSPMNKEKNRLRSASGEGSSLHREDGTTQTVVDRVKGLGEQHQMEVIDGRFVRQKDEIFV